MADRLIKPVDVIEQVLAVTASYIGTGEMDKVKHTFPPGMQNLFPALASVA